MNFADLFYYITKNNPSHIRFRHPPIVLFSYRSTQPTIERISYSLFHSQGLQSCKFYRKLKTQIDYSQNKTIFNKKEYFSCRNQTCISSNRKPVENRTSKNLPSLSLFIPIKGLILTQKRRVTVNYRTNKNYFPNPLGE